MQRAGRSARGRGKRGFTLIEVSVAAFLVALSAILFAALYPTAYRTSRMNADYSQAVSAVQHKVDQLRAVGYGRLTFSELRSAGIIDTTSRSSPFRFEQVDNLGDYLTDPVGTITLTSAGSQMVEARVRLEWRGTPTSTRRSSHEVAILIPNE